MMRWKDMTGLYKHQADHKGNRRWGKSKSRPAGPKLSERDLEKCARCGAIRWDHETKQGWLVPDHAFVERES